MANLTTQQTIKVKVNALDGSLVAQNKQPVVLKNTVQESIGVGALGNVNEGTPTASGTLVYNTTTEQYDVRQLTVRDLGDVVGNPSDGDMILYESSSNTFLYGSPVVAVGDLADVNSAGKANGTVLSYDASSNTYKHSVVLVANSSGSLASVNTGSLSVNGGVVITSITNFANSTQLGSSSSGSQTELATVKAVKDYVDTMVAQGGGGGGGGAVNLNGLLDVYIDGGGLINRQVLLFNGATNEWVNRDIHGTANNIRMTTNSNNDIVIALANDVNISGSLNVPSANIIGITANTLTVNHTAAIGNNASVSGVLGVGRELTVARAATFGSNVSIANTLTVTGTTLLNGNATINAISTFTNIVTIQANASVGQQLTTNNVTISGVLNTTGNVVLGNTSSTLVVNSKLAGDIIPAANNTYSLGSQGMRFKDIYLSGATLYLGDVVLSTASGALVLDGDQTTSGVATFQSNVVMQDRLSVANTATFSGNVVVSGVLGSNVIPSANLTHNLGSATKQFANVYAGNVIAGNGNFGDVVVSGNLVVQGDLTRISVSSMEVEDPLIQLSSNNTSDAVDIGFYGLYNNGSSDLVTGLFRDASDSGKFVLFDSLVGTAKPGTTVNRTHASFNVATLVAYINSGALTANATNVAITANSTVGVSILANTVSVSTPIEVASGGVGRGTITTNSVMVGNGTGPIKQITGTTMQVLSMVGGVPTFVSNLDAGEY